MFQTTNYYVTAGLLILFAVTTTFQQSSYPLPEPSVEERQFKVVYEWQTLSFAYRSQEERDNAMYSGAYIARNNLISDVKAFANRLYVTVPRMLPGVPATLGWIIAPDDNGRTDPEIEPFPSWDMNAIGNCSALQFVQGIAVDTDGIMWVIDSGRIDTLAQGENAHEYVRSIKFEFDTNLSDSRQVRFPTSTVARSCCCSI